MIGDLRVTKNGRIANSLYVGNGINVGNGGIQSDGAIVVRGSHPSSSLVAINDRASSTSWGAYINTLLIGNVESATGTDDWEAIIKYDDGGLCLDDTGTAATCPETPGASILADGAITASDFDLAEIYDINGSATKTDLLVLTSSTAMTVEPSSGVAYDSSIIGVYSSSPGFVLGWNRGAQVALKGRVPVKASVENGPISIGDPLTSASIPGHVMRATKPGMIVGYALENATTTSAVEVFINIEHYDGTLLGTDGIDALITDDLVVDSIQTPSASDPIADSWGLSFRGAAWDTDISDIVTHEFTFQTDIISAVSSTLSIFNTANTEIFSLDQEGNGMFAGDFHLGGRLYPSTRSGVQDDWYIFIDDTLAPTSTYVSTNADGWQSLDTYDFAERYYSPDELRSGDLVVIKDTGTTHVQRSWEPDQMLLGIVSTRPAFIAGRPGENQYPIALSGRVPTKVSTMNGPIQSGDALAPSTIPGVAVKAIGPGPIVGLALEDYSEDKVGKIEVFVNPGWWGGSASDLAADEEGLLDSEEISSGATGEVIQGFALIQALQQSVRIEFDDLGAYPNIQVTPYAQVEGNWWIDQDSDTSFVIRLDRTPTRELRFAWRVTPSGSDPVVITSEAPRAPAPDPAPDPEPEPEPDLAPPEPEAPAVDPEPESSPEQEPEVEAPVPAEEESVPVTEPEPEAPAPDPAPEPEPEPDLSSATEPEVTVDPEPEPEEGV